MTQCYLIFSKMFVEVREKQILRLTFDRTDNACIALGRKIIVDRGILIDLVVEIIETTIIIMTAIIY